MQFVFTFLTFTIPFSNKLLTPWDTLTSNSLTRDPRAEASELGIFLVSFSSFLHFFSRRCGNNKGLIRKYDLNLCRRCFRERAVEIGFKKVFSFLVISNSHHFSFFPFLSWTKCVLMRLLCSNIFCDSPTLFI